MKITRNIEFYFEELDLDITLECSLIEDEFCIGLNDVSWDKEEYTEEENIQITEEINKYWDKIEYNANKNIEQYLL